MSAISWLGCSQSALLHSVSSFAALPCIMSVQLQSVSSAVFCQLSCNLSALAYSVMQFICYDRPAARYQLSYEVQAPLQSVISAAICLLSHDMSAWQQSVGSVCQLSCNIGPHCAQKQQTNGILKIVVFWCSSYNKHSIFDDTTGVFSTTK